MEIIPIKASSITGRTPDLAGLAEAFLADLDLSESSRETYSRSMRQFISWLEETGRAGRVDLLREDILAYKDYLISSKSSYTVSLYLTTVRKLYQYLESKRIYPDVTRGIRGNTPMVTRCYHRTPHGRGDQGKKSIFTRKTISTTSTI